jgi:hypothetical protein
MSDLPAWIQPGERATLIWHEGRYGRPDGVSVYEVSGPALDRPPAAACYLMAPAERGDFAGRLYRGEVTVADLREFLQACSLAEGAMGETCERVLSRAAAPALPLLDAWLERTEPPLLPYLADISAFFLRDRPLYMSSDAVAAARGAAETFTTAWVCQECGDADDLGVFVWTRHRGPRVRVCLLIENDAGVWTCHLHPFEFERQDVQLPSAEGKPLPVPKV